MRCRSLSTCLFLLGFTFLLLCQGPAIAQDAAALLPPNSQPGAKIAFHVKAAATKQRCSAIDAVPCSQYVTEGAIQTGYDVYVSTVNADFIHGIGGMEFGIDYDGVGGSGIDIFGWESCSDLEFPSTSWPAAGEGTILTWATCQETQVSNEGVHAVGGVFYVYAYSADAMTVVPRPTPSLTGLIAVADCEGGQTEVPAPQVGSVSFGLPPGTGVNPCAETTDDCDLSSTTLIFGSVLVSSSATRSLTITNSGTSVIGGVVSLTGADCDEFTITSGGGPLSLNPGESQDITVRFAPGTSGIGLQTCTLLVGDCGSVPVSGVGLGSAPCIVSALSLDFGTVQIGETATLPLEIANGFTTEVTASLSPNNCSSEFSWIPPIEIVLAPGEIDTVEISFTPTTDGTVTCNFRISGDCDEFIMLTGLGVDSCSPDISGGVNFGTQVLHTTTTSSFGIINEDNASVSVDLSLAGQDCAQYSVTPSGSVVIPGNSTLAVDVSFTPTLLGTQACTLEVAGECGEAIPLTGIGQIGPLANCRITPTTTDFGPVKIGMWRDRVVRLTNIGDLPISGDLTTSCPEFSVLAPSAYDLDLGEFQDFTIRFQPTQEVEYHCSVNASCAGSSLRGVGISPSSPSPQIDAKLAFHLATPVSKSHCTELPEVPCSEFVSEGDVGTAYTAYVAVADLSLSEGFLGTDFGLDYGANLEIYEWIACSDLEFPSPTFPASGAGTLLTWQTCQENYIPGHLNEGGVEFVGTLYLYAYGSETLTIGPRPVPIQSPNVADCDNQESFVPEIFRGRAEFGNGEGYNPCTAGSGTPVRLLSSSANRIENTIEFSWKVAEDAGLGQGLFRLQESGVYEPVSPVLFGESGTYAFTLTDAPAEAVTYWIGANEREGERTWLGSFDVQASTTTLLPLAVNQNRPNPFRGTTRLSFVTQSEGYAEVSVFDLNGREVAKPFAQFTSSGTHEVVWNGKDQRGHELSSGVYLYRVRAAGKTITKKMLLVRD